MIKNSTRGIEKKKQALRFHSTKPSVCVIRICFTREILTFILTCHVIFFKLPESLVCSAVLGKKYITSENKF